MTVTTEYSFDYFRCLFFQCGGYHLTCLHPRRHGNAILLGFQGDIFGRYALAVTKPWGGCYRIITHLHITQA